MARASLLHVLTLSVALMCCCQSAFSKLRVRKEIRDLTAREYGMYLQGLSTMLTVPTDVGKIVFGPKYHDMNYFVIVHACNALYPDGVALKADIAHFGPWFMTFHRAIELLFENSLLSVVPSLKAMPYWKMYQDMAGGEYYNTSRFMFTPKYAGSLSGDPDNGYAVMDGPFAARPIGKFNYYKYRDLAPWYNGSSTGLLRGPNNVNFNPLFTRFPAVFATTDPPGPAGPMDAGLDMVFTRSTFLRCANTSLVTSSWDFINCIDLPASIFAGLPANPTWLAYNSAFTHGIIII